MPISGTIYISGGEFNFTDGGYVPPTWSGSVYNFGAPDIEQWVDTNLQWTDDNLDQWLDGITESGTLRLRQVWTDNQLYIYAATSLGLRIIDAPTENVLNDMTYIPGFNTVWCNDYNVFLGTNYGIKYLSSACIDINIDTDLLPCLNDLDFYYGTSSNVIRYLHGNENLLLCITDAEVDVLSLTGTIYRSSSTTVSGNAYKGFMTSTGKFYYTLSGSNWSVERVDVPVMDWTTPHRSYAADGSIMTSGIAIRDIFATERTSANGTDNTLFIATSSGVYVIDEGTNDYAVYYTTGG